MPRLVLLPVAALVLGCGSMNIRGELFPPPQSRPAEAPLYVQARQYAISTPPVAAGRREDGFGLTLDVYNRSRSAVTRGSVRPRRLAAEVRGAPGERPCSATDSGELPGAVPSPDEQPADARAARTASDGVGDVRRNRPGRRSHRPTPGTGRSSPCRSDGLGVDLQLTDPADARVLFLTAPRSACRSWPERARSERVLPTRWI